MLIARQFSRTEIEDNVLRNTSDQDALKQFFSYRFQNPPGKKEDMNAQKLNLLCKKLLQLSKRIFSGSLRIKGGERHCRMVWSPNLIHALRVKEITIGTTYNI